jgi:transcriptional regulator with XRE-family HTH domain
MGSLAWEVGVPKGYLSRIESGQKAPSLTMLGALSRELGVEAWELLRAPAGEVEVEAGG